MVSCAQAVRTDTRGIQWVCEVCIFVGALSDFARWKILIMDLGCCEPRKVSQTASVGRVATAHKIDASPVTGASADSWCGLLLVSCWSQFSTQSLRSTIWVTPYFPSRSWCVLGEHCTRVGIVVVDAGRCVLKCTKHTSGY